MSSTLRAAAVASSAALLIGGLGTYVGVAGATTSAARHPAVLQTTVGTAAVSRTALVYGDKLTVTGTVATQISAAAVRGQSAVLQRKAHGSSWFRMTGTSAKTTNSQGSVHWTVVPGASESFRVVFQPTSVYAGVTSAGHAVKVSPKLTLEKVHTLPARTTSEITGTIAPHVTGTIKLQKLVDGVWRHAATATVHGGTYSFSVTPTSLTSLQYRVLYLWDGHLATTASRSITVHIVNRDLSIGDSGSDVLALEKRLKALDYDLGPVSDSYGYDALHAVTAFEKVQGLTPNGEVTTSVWKALTHPRVPRLYYANPGLKYAVEVSLHKQIVKIARYGKLWRILDTSTAGGYLYKNSSGGESRAITPTGHFTFQYKITGYHKSSLGELYYPSYFTNTGYAIHGEGNGNDGGEVPPYPNSHGCVRITNDAVLRYYYSVFTVGTNVWIY